VKAFCPAARQLVPLTPTPPIVVRPLVAMFPRNVLAYALVLFAVFQYGLVSARPQFPQYGKRAALLSDASDLQTNAARMAQGLAPLKPRNLYIPSRVGNEILFLLHCSC